MREIADRGDIFLLVSSFYQEIKKDELLGPIFHQHIAKEEWPMHLEKLTDFWVTTLLGEACFKGNPSQAHLKVDKNLNHTIDQIHFGKWLQLWFTTIDSLYVGPLAQRAKDTARKMATGQYINIWKKRDGN